MNDTQKKEEEQNTLTKKQAVELKQEEKRKAREKEIQVKKIKNTMPWVLLIVFVVGGIYGLARLSENDISSEDGADNSNVISTRGLHWHPTLKIVIRGEEVEIPANIGLVGGHNPMHTHETDGTIHLEFESLVREDNITLERFFELWGKPFSSNQILEYTNTGTEQVHMYVNGEESMEYENYVLGERDEIEIRFE